MTCHKCVKKGHIQKDCRSKRNGSSGSPTKKSEKELLEWVTNNPVVSYNKDLATDIMTLKKKEI